MAQHGGVVLSISASPSDSFWYMWRQLQLPCPKLTQLRSLDLSRIKVSSSNSIISRGGSSSRINTSSGSSISSTAAAVTGSNSSDHRCDSNMSTACCIDSADIVSLPKLQELKIRDCELTVTLLSQLLSATSLTKLHRECRDPLLYGSSTWSSQLSQGQAYSALWQRLQLLLPQLVDFKLHVGSLTASDIAPLSSLQHLQHLDILQQSLWSDDDESGPRELLAALQHLTQLRHLQLEDMALYRVSPQPDAEQDSYQCFSGLTASTHLTALRLTECDKMLLPQAAFDFMFRRGHYILPDLKVINLHGRPGGPCVDAAQVSMIAASCSALQELRLVNVTPSLFMHRHLLALPPGVTRVEGLDWSRPAA